MKENAEKKRLFKHILLVILIFGLVSILNTFFFNKKLKETIDCNLEGNITYTVSQEDVIEIEDFRVENGKVKYTVSPKNEGKCLLEIHGNDEIISYTQYYKVNALGKLINLNNLNHPGYKKHMIILALTLIALSGVFWASFKRAIYTLGYSYHSMFVCGFAIWLSVCAILVLISVGIAENMYSVYETLQLSGHYFMICTLPLVLVFGISLSISNIRLIQKEGFRFVNVLGIILSILLLTGESIGVFMHVVDYSDYELKLKIYRAIYSIFTSSYSLFECLLMGAIICGLMAAKYKPNLDRDYIIILGCGIREDGTLYPLIQGRVDRAIAFYKEQLEKTGKQAILVPSGGKGTDEIISEAEAMKNYLLQQGIPKSQILVENQSKNTLENMKFSKKLIEERTKDAKVAFSTTNYHVFRSGVISRQAGFNPEGMGSDTKWYFWPNAFIREFVGVLSYKKVDIIIILIPLIIFFVFINLYLGII